MSVVSKLDAVRAELTWLVHGCVVHPICSLLSLAAAVTEALGNRVAAWYLDGMSQWLHDKTMPRCGDKRGRS